MEEKEFLALVNKLENYAHKRPGAYKLRVALLAALGYIFLIGTTVFLLLVVGVIVYFGSLNWILIKFLLVPLGLALIVLESLWVKFPELEGHELYYEDAPRLFDFAKSTREATNGPRLHKVLLTGEFNAAIAQRPRLGVFGWQENYLLIGLPLLRALSPDEVRAVLAHEFGHLSGKHGQFTAWIYRVRQTWDEVLKRMRYEEKWGSGIFETFFKWYAPYFAAYSYVLARAREYEADRTSIQLCGKEDAARALIKLNLRAKSLSEDFWPNYFKRANTEAEPPKEAFTELLTSLRQPLPVNKVQMWFTQLLTEKHGYDDTHPVLADRLEAIGYPELRTTYDLTPFLKDGEHRGEEYFLQSVPSDFVATNNRLWREDILGTWRERHGFVVEAAERLATLEEKARTEELTLEDRWERARLLYVTQGAAVAMPLLKEIVAAEPDHASANYLIGEALLEQGDEAGIRNVEQAMERDVHSIPAGCELIYNFLTRLEREEEAERYRRCVIDYYREIELAQQERNSVSTKDVFKYHEMVPEIIGTLTVRLKDFSELGTAHLVQKVVHHFPEMPSYVLGIRCKKAWYRWHSTARDRKLVNQVAAGLPSGNLYVIALEDGYKPLREVFGQIQGSEIYRAL